MPARPGEGLAERQGGLAVWPLWKPKTAARYLRMEPAEVGGLMSSGVIRALRIERGVVRVDPLAVLDFAAANGIEPLREYTWGRGFVYVIRGAGLCKIGFAIDVRSRLTTLQTGSPVELEVVHFFRALKRSEETVWHHRFKDKRRHGEWFALTDEDVAAFVSEGGRLKTKATSHNGRHYVDVVKLGCSASADDADTARAGVPLAIELYRGAA